MWRDFQIAEFVSVGETFSAWSPIAARCWLTRSTTCCARSWRSVPHALSGVQLPTAAKAAPALTGTAAGDATSKATAANPTAASRFVDFNIRCPPVSVRLTTASKDGLDQPNGMECLLLPG